MRRQGSSWCVELKWVEIIKDTRWVWALPSTALLQWLFIIYWLLNFLVKAELQMGSGWVFLRIETSRILCRSCEAYIRMFMLRLFILFYFLVVFFQNYSIIHCLSFSINNCGNRTNRKWKYRHGSVLPLIRISYHTGP